MCRLVRVELGEDTVPDESTIQRFQCLLDRRDHTAQIFDGVKALLEEQRLLLKVGAFVDATIAGALGSTKCAKKTRDPEIKHTRKGNQW